MLTFEDCLAYCGLSAGEVAAIAEHEHLPEIAALELGNYLVHSADGEVCIRKMIIEDIEAARRAGDTEHAETLEAVLRHFLATHPRLASTLTATT